MEKSENESDSSGDYVDATDDPFSYSEEPESLAAASLDTEIQKIRKNKVENTLSNVTIPEINKFLVERMNPDFGILDKLLASKALSRAEIAEVGRLSTFYEQNTRLLELLTKNEKLTELFNALKDTNQEHLVNYVTAKGEYSPDYGGAWPLTERETSILDVNQESLVNLLDFTGNEIVQKLCGLNVLNQRQKEFICKQPYDYKKAGVLLDFLYRSSMSDYWKMITCLRGTNQQRVAKILFDGGAVVRVHNAVTGDTEAVTTAEKDIVERIDSMLSNMDLEESSRVLERLQLKLFAVRAGHSVNLYILCETVDELMHLSNLLTSGELQRGIKRFFNELISRSETVHVFSTVSQETLYKCKMFLEADRSQKKVSSKDILKLCEQMKVEEECRTEEEQEEEPMEGVGAKGEFEKSSNEDDRTATSNTVMNDLPLELLDMILRKVYRNSCVIGNRLGQSTDEEIVLSLASVDYCWFQRITRRKFRSNIWRNLKGFYRKFYKGIVICRNTRMYLAENIQTKGMFEMFEKLRSVDCLTDIQTRLVNRGEDRRLVQKGKDTSRRLSGKKEELLHFAKSLDGPRYSAFVQCLLENKQNLCARVASNGGVVIRADIQTSNLENRKSVEQQMVKAVSYLRDRTRSKPPPLERQLKRLKADNIEILNSLLDRNPVVWFWCHTKSGLAKLEKDSDLVLKLFNLQSIARPSEIVKVKTFNIDSDRFRKQFAAELEFCERLSIEGDVRVRGLTQLRNCVYVLCRFYSLNPNSIQVFADQHPFPLRHKISIDDITEPEDIGCSEAENCLYVTDSATDRCIWKISTSDHRPTKWLTSASDEPFTVSLSVDGQLLMVRKSNPVSNLVIYGADSVLRGTYPMPVDIYNPQHAVKTPSGTFMVLHELKQDKVDANDPRGGQLWTVSELARDAQITIRRFDPKGSEQQLDRPTYLALDSDEQVFVLDTWAERIVLLDSELNWKRVLTKTGDALSSPLWSLRAHYDALSHRLMVAGLATVDFYTEDMPNLKEEPQFLAAASMELDNQDLGKRKAELIQKHKELLKERLDDTSFGILDILFYTDGLTPKEMTAIKNCSTNPVFRSKELIMAVLKKNIVPKLIMALEYTNQTHLVNYIGGDAVYNEEFRDDWPLGDDRIKQINVNQGRLINIIEPCDSGLISLLLSAKVINDRQFRSLSEGKNPIKKNKALLNIMRRLSVKDYSLTIDCLIKSNQAHIAKILQETGVIQRIHVSQGGDPRTVNQTEDALSDRLADLFRDRPVEEAQRIMEMTQLRICAAKKGD